jgi:hypothetical protein
MYSTQLSINFFWPLTEQIFLDLDFTESLNFIEEKRKQDALKSITYFDGSLVTAPSWGSITAAANPLLSISQSQMVVDTDSITFKVKKKPSFIQRIVYKTLGVKWEIKQ